MTSIVYLPIFVVFIIALTAKIGNLRALHKVPLGDGGHTDLQKFQRAHANMIEYLPLAFVLLFVLEFNGGNLWLIHGFALLFVVGRIAHIRSILTSNFTMRKISMSMTFTPFIALSLANLYYLPWGKLV